MRSARGGSEPVRTNSSADSSFRGTQPLGRPRSTLFLPPDASSRPKASWCSPHHRCPEVAGTVLWVIISRSPHRLRSDTTKNKKTSSYQRGALIFGARKTSISTLGIAHFEPRVRQGQDCHFLRQGPWIHTGVFLLLVRCHPCTGLR